MLHNRPVNRHHVLVYCYWDYEQWSFAGYYPVVDDIKNDTFSDIKYLT
jgi:hypothetical protein